MFQTKVVPKLKTHILCSITFFSPENRVIYETKWINTVRAEQATYDNMAHAHSMLDNTGYKYTHTQVV